eukprot:1887533-Amphidinium_carterae.1
MPHLHSAHACRPASPPLRTPNPSRACPHSVCILVCQCATSESCWKPFWQPVIMMHAKHFQHHLRQNARFPSNWN